MKKKKNNGKSSCYLIALLFMILSYYLLESIILAILNGLYFFVIIYKYVTLSFIEVNNKIDTYEEFSHFANGLIMQLSVTPNINDSFKQIASINKKEYSEILEDDSLSINEKLESLENYFPIPLYHILRHILLLYIEQGGNIIDMSQELLNKCDNELSNMQEIYSLNKQKWIESVVMWGFAIIGFLYLRSSLISYYLTLIKNSSFMVCVEVFLLVFITTLKLVSKKYIKEQVEL